MDQFKAAGVYKGDCILLTKNGDAYRVWFDNDFFPFIEKIVIVQNVELTHYLKLLACK